MVKMPEGKDFPGDSSPDGGYDRNDKVARIPNQFLNSLGFIVYDHYGRKPWNSWDEAKWDIFLPPHYMSITSLLGIDCEMVGVGEYKDSALGRVSIVNEFGYCVYDTFVKPLEDVTDYRTQFSGIRAEDLATAPDVENVLEDVAAIVDSKILVGHSIHNDLDVLKLNNHPRSLIRDTSIYFKKDLKTKGIPSLRDLSSKFLRVNIQTGEHSSIQDAQATLKLYLMHREKWEDDFTKRRENANLTLECHSVTTTTPDDISDMHVEPREPDLFVDSETVFLRENKIVGAYSSCEEYLDTQFRLLLEDFLRPLRDCVNNVNQWQKFQKNSLFHNVQIRIGGKSENFEVRKSGTILVPIERNNLNDIDWEESNIFLNGSLLLLTPDNFKSVKFAVIKFRQEFREELIDPHFVFLNVEFSKHGPSWTVGAKNNRFLMMESKAFYEAYKHTLEYLQTVDLNKFPLKKYIVDAVTTAQPPKYLLSVANKLDFSVLMTSTLESRHNLGSQKVAPLDLRNWPNASQLNLDESQFEAFQRALTQEMTIIQGPPGTGKTFIGTQIIKLLLSNPLLLNSPILVVAYTNHALDQTLEQVLDFVTTDNICAGNEKAAHNMILRIGGGSKSELIQPLVLRHKVEKYLEKKRHAKKLDLLQKILNSVKDLRFEDLLVQQGILNFQKLPKVILEKLSQDKKSKVMFQKWQSIEQQIKKDALNWFGLKHKGSGGVSNENGNKKNVLFMLIFDKCYSAYSYFESLNKDVYPGKISKICEELKDSNTDKINMFAARWTQYFFLVICVKDLIEEMQQKMTILQKEYLELQHSLSKNMSIRAAKVIGMTTTGAVKHKCIVRKTRPKIMIVEEAAHVLEAHVVASLTEHCQQMIMIGDHKQLRPLTADYNLATDYNLDVSLMERLVKNGVDQGNHNWTQLKVQHRMRPEIARMVCPVIYEELYNHSDVLQYPNVKGCSKNLFFIDHQNEEGREKGSRSYFNEYEVNFLSALVKYFVNGGFYQPHQITVIATYLAQKVLIENKLKYLCEYSKLKVSTVDGYQGEENDIILLSLVRNNDQNGIGFLKTDNRVCVALSRARHGLFMIGNMSCLKAESETWEKINTTLTEMKSIGISLPLTKSGFVVESVTLNPRNLNLPVNQNKNILPRSEIVENVVTSSAIPKENISKVSEKLILQRLPCGHNRKVTETQMRNKCLISVEKTLRCGHIQTVECHKKDAIALCTEKFQKMLPCGHQGMRPCHEENWVTFFCVVPVCKQLPCGHHGLVRCFAAPCSQDCKTKTLKELPCGHKGMVPCGEDAQKTTQKCSTMVETLLSCGHQQQVQCYQLLSENKCRTIIERELPCGHKGMAPCGEDIQKIQVKCKAIVQKLLACGHQQQVHCYQPLPKVKCTETISKELPCGHKQAVHCHQPVSSIKCNILVSSCEHGKLPCHEAVKIVCSIRVMKDLPCGHKVKIYCCDRLQQVECNVMVESTLPCGHFQINPCHASVRGLSKCLSLVMKNLPCGHSQEMACHQHPSEVYCRMLVPSKKCSQSSHNEMVECFTAKNNLMSASCDRQCVKIFNCGHQCPFLCHENNKSLHLQYRCSEKCQRLCPSGHSCTENHECYKFCSLTAMKECICKGKLAAKTKKSKQKGQPVLVSHSAIKVSSAVSVEKLGGASPKMHILPCGHQKELTKVQMNNVSTVKCLLIVEKKLPCGHLQKVECFKGAGNICMKKVNKDLPCGHQMMLLCHENPQKILIKCKKVTNKLLSCGHHNKVACNRPLSDVKCTVTVTKEMPCGHTIYGHCHQSVSTMKCTLNVSCGHLKSMPCHQASLRYCNISTTKSLACGHIVQVSCGENVSKIKCYTMTESIFPCGHLLKYPCHFQNKTICLSLVMKKLPCGHNQEAECSQNPLEILCKTFVSQSTNCSHSVMKIIECYKAKTTGSSPSCDRQCEKIFKCGHQCRLLCHGNENSAHATYSCIEKCQRSCSKGHRCTGNHECYRGCTLNPKTCKCKKITTNFSPGPSAHKIECGNTNQITQVEKFNLRPVPIPSIKNASCEHVLQDSYSNSKSGTTSCSILMTKDLPCGHKVKVACSKNISKMQCEIMVESTLSCGHIQKYPCSSNATKCSAYISKMLPCGHEQKGACHKISSEIYCKKLVLSNCSHKVMVQCHEARNDPGACNCQCRKIFKCGHQCPLVCHEDDENYHSQIKCVEKCQRSCSNGHRCSDGHKCYTNCLLTSKNSKCKKMVATCSHKVVECYRTNPVDRLMLLDTSFCDIPCGKILKCGHRCPLLCHKNDPEHVQFKCIERCRRSCPDGHPCSEDHQCWLDCPFESGIECSKCVISLCTATLRRMKDMKIE